MVFTAILVGIYVDPVRWEPPNLWSTMFGTQGPNLDNRVTSISPGAGGLYVAGYVGFSMGYVNATPSQLFVSRYDLSHRQVWYQSLGSRDGSEVTGVTGSEDGVYATGAINLTGFVRKYGSEGSLVWTNNFTIPMSISTYSYGISSSTTGVYAIMSDHLSNSSFPVTLRAFDFEGKFLWISTIGNFDPQLVSVSAGANGLYVSGFPTNGSSGFVQRYSFSGALVWNRGLSCVCWPTGVGTDGTGVYVAGRNGNDIEAFISKYDWDGSQLWIHQFRPPQTAVYRLSMSVDSSGVYMALITNVANYLAKYDENGNSQWLFQIPSAPYSVAVGGGGVYVGGGTEASLVSKEAALSEYSQSSSLIFFGLNPPLSFLAVSLLTATATISMLWLRKRARTRAGNFPHRVNS